MRRLSSLSGSSKQWIHRQHTDVYVKNSLADGYRSRAAYKLLEIQERYRGVLKRGDRVVDAGAAPGSWTQVAVEICSEKRRSPQPQQQRSLGATTAVEPEASPTAVSTLSSRRRVSIFDAPSTDLGIETSVSLSQSLSSQSPLPKTSGRVVGVDKRFIVPLPGALFVEGDLTQPAVRSQISSMFGGARADVVLSDMAHNFAGHDDATLQSVLSWTALAFCCGSLRSGGNAVIKSRHGSSHPAFVDACKARFRRCYEFKPPASRTDSSETYVIGLGFTLDVAHRLSPAEQGLVSALGIDWLDGGTLNINK